MTEVCLLLMIVLKTLVCENLRLIIDFILELTIYKERNNKNHEK